MTDCVIISRGDAKAAGLKRYFTGEPCHAGHVAERRVSDCQCIECNRLKARDPAERERRKGYMAVHQRKYRADHPDVIAAYEAKRDKAARAKAKRDARAIDPEPTREALRKSYQKHKAKRNAEMKLWRIANKAAQLAYMRCWKAMRRANPPEGKFTPDDIEMIFERQDGECAAFDCLADLSEGFEIDHIHPIAKGGSNWPSNLQLLCLFCNRSKGYKTMQEWEDLKAQNRVELH
jgi:5-methylcytosine-specific restriction endonuclease McrA